MIRRLLRNFLRLIVGLIILLVLPLFYIHLWCNSWSGSAATDLASVNRVVPETLKGDLDGIDKRVRKGSNTLLTFPEWYIVFTSQDYARFLAKNPPSGFSYFGSAFGFWGCYCDANRVASARYPYDWDMHIVNYVIGVSHTVEFVFKGIYENTIGRLSELFAPEEVTSEEKFARVFFSDYANSLNTVPWFEYDFDGRLAELRTQVSKSGPGSFRKCERRLALSAELWVKSFYGGLIKSGTRSTFEAAVPTTVAVLKDAPADLVAGLAGVSELKREGAFSIVKFPRYAPFRDLLPSFENTGATFVDIAGNKTILVTAKILGSFDNAPGYFKPVLSSSLLSGETGTRRGFLVPVEKLIVALEYLKQKGHVLEHVYDF